MSLYGDISNAMDEIIAKHQQLNNITSGDIAPDLYNEFCDELNNMTMIIEKILKAQK